MLAMLLGFGALLACSAWYYFGRGESQADELEPSQMTATAIAGNSKQMATVTLAPTPTGAATATAYISVPSLSLSPILTPTATSLVRSSPPAYRPVAMSLFDSPLPTPTPTARAFDYDVIGHDVHPEGSYSFVSGWIVEADGSTPRPVAVRLSYTSGELRYPRPNNVDVADGRYEFLVSPGQYWLSVDDPGSPRVPITIGDTPQRHEISFRLVIDRPLAQPARSSPWAGPHKPGSPNKPRSGVTPTPTATPTATPAPRVIFLPIVTRAWNHRYYLPFVTNQARQMTIYLPMVTR